MDIQIRLVLTVLLVGTVVVSAYLVELGDRGKVDAWLWRSNNNSAVRKMLVDEHGHCRRNTRRLLAALCGVFLAGVWFGPA